MHGRFRNVTLPLISPTTFFLLVLQMIGAFQLFTEPFVMTRRPSQLVAQRCAVHLQCRFPRYSHGQGPAMAWFLFAFILLFTLIQNRLQRRWVFYEAG